MALFRIQHITRYLYEFPVSESVNELRIYPIPGSDQEVLQHELIITGDPEIQIYQDYWGNRTGFFNVLEGHQELKVESRLLVRTVAPDSDITNNVGSFTDLHTQIQKSLLLLELSKAEQIVCQHEIIKICSDINDGTRNIGQLVESCSRYIFDNFTYKKGITNIETTVDEIMKLREGVCQDFAHVLLQLLRTAGIPCRYVSGYICPNKNGMRGEGATHAWVEAYIPQKGWCGIDPTNNTWVGETHVKLAVGRNFKDCTPVKGTFKGATRQHLFVYVSVGYEDGHVFEETTEVKMDKIEQPAISEKEILAAMAAQQ
jgi:transglutaminase-like putative cysteine protease